MVFRDWRAAVKFLDQQTKSASASQRALAGHLGARLPANTPRIVASAKLRGWLADDLRLPNGDSGVPEWLLEQLAATTKALGRKRLPTYENLAEAEAWLEHFDLCNNLASIRQLQVAEGDLVLHLGKPQLVSSIDRQGRIWFKGGRGSRAWATSVERVPGSLDPHDLRRQAKNRIAAAGPNEPSQARVHDLRESLVDRHSVRPSQLKSLRDVVDRAEDESPIQAFLEKNPELLAPLLRGPHSFVMCQPRLADEYVPDFVLGDVDSNGFRWVLMEIETPRSETVLKTKNEFDVKARAGVSQIMEWREWLKNNLAKARELQSRGGTGLASIDPSPDGLVVVGRRDQLRQPRASVLRNQTWENNRIQVITYDRLIELIEGSLKKPDSPVYNDFILARE